MSALAMAVLLASSSDVAFDRVAQAFVGRDLTRARLALEHALVAGPPSRGPAAVGSAGSLWAELFDLVDCVPLEAAQLRPLVPRNEWELLVGLARLERLRLRRLSADEPGPAHDLQQAGFFARPALSDDGDDVVRWPAEEELWDDETLTVALREPSCGVRRAPSQAELARWTEEERALAQALLERLDADHPAFAPVRLFLASLELRGGAVEAALEASGPLFGRSAEFAPREADQTTLLEAMDCERRGDRAGARRRYASIVGSPNLPRVQAFIEARLQRDLLADRRFDELVARLPERPDVASATGRYQAYLLGRALLATGRYDRLLDHVRETLRRAGGSWTRDPALSLLADLEYGFLATAPFDDRVVELVESLAEPRALYARIERLAIVAQDRGRPDSARAALEWLLAHHHAGDQHPRYQARLSFVAFEGGDRPAFLARLRELTRPSEALLAAVAPARRGAFFSERDQELLELVASVVPRLAERADDGWTAPFVDTLQAFLQEAPTSRQLAPLTDLYRTARGLLGTGARAYAERIGAKTPSLALGEVLVDRPWPEPPAPAPPPEVDEPRSVVRLPLSAAPRPTRGWFEAAR